VIPKLFTMATFLSLLGSANKWKLDQN
jgi:hypothetical protein